MLAAQAITVQVALLYTNALGERRIRVHTVLLPVVQVHYIILIFKRRAPMIFHIDRSSAVFSLLSSSPISIYFFSMSLHVLPILPTLTSTLPPFPPWPCILQPCVPFVLHLPSLLSCARLTAHLP